MARLTSLAALAAASAAQAAVFLPAIFKDSMVLQTPADGGRPASIFGYAAPGESVVVNMTVPAQGMSSYRATADRTTGKWSVVVAPAGPDLAPSGVSFSIAAASDAAPTLIGNVSFGEVILCNGQSNMVLSVAGASNPVGRPAPPSPQWQYQTWPTIRLYSVITQNASTPQRDLPTYVNAKESRCSWGWVGNMTNQDLQVCQTWQVAAPGVTDFFSAECFYTAVYLLKSGAIPADRTIGLIQSAYSGTAMETWIPPEAYDGCPSKPYPAAGALQLAGALAPVGDIPSQPQCLWNAMINPIVGYGLRTVLHNQIESNMGDGFQYYACVFQNMVATWRARWGIGDFPWLTTGLGDQGFSPDNGGKNTGWPSYVSTPRDGQMSILPGRYPGVSRTVGGGIVSAYDKGDRVGNPNGVWDVHSRFKSEVGRRMALVWMNATGMGVNGTAGPTFWNGPVPAGNATLHADGTITLTWVSDSMPGPAGVWHNGTQDCWECCDGALAQDTFRVSTELYAANETNWPSFVNTTWSYDAATATVTITPVSQPKAGQTWVSVQHNPSLWPQCAWYSTANNVPALPFSDLGISPAAATAGTSGSEQRRPALRARV